MRRVKLVSIRHHYLFQIILKSILEDLFYSFASYNNNTIGYRIEYHIFFGHTINYLAFIRKCWVYVWWNDVAKHIKICHIFRIYTRIHFQFCGFHATLFYRVGWKEKCKKFFGHIIIPKTWIILKCFVRSFYQAWTSHFWKVILCIHVSCKLYLLQCARV